MSFTGFGGRTSRKEIADRKERGERERIARIRLEEERLAARELLIAKLSSGKKDAKQI
jgi:hypothetical protein